MQRSVMTRSGGVRSMQASASSPLPAAMTRSPSVANTRRRLSNTAASSSTSRIVALPLAALVGIGDVSWLSGSACLADERGEKRRSGVNADRGVVVGDIRGGLIFGGQKHPAERAMCGEKLAY